MQNVNVAADMETVPLILVGAFFNKMTNFLILKPYLIPLTGAGFFTILLGYLIL